MMKKFLKSDYVPALLALSDGRLFYGRSIGATGTHVGEVVFNTSMTGYQEILSDPSYAQQIITLTYPHIGNVGVNSRDWESTRIYASGLVVRDASLCMSSWRGEQTLSDFLKEHKVIGISDIDTRQLTRFLRDEGSQNACIMAGDIDPEKAVALAKGFSGLANMDLAQKVTRTTPMVWNGSAQWCLATDTYTQIQAPLFTVVAYDFGIKNNILRKLAERGCKVVLVPAQTDISDVLAMSPDGVFLSNGPGDPQPCDYAIEAAQVLMEKKIPLFGICLGFQIMGLASGAQTLKMKFGHHGGNHPVEDVVTKKVYITSQNHGFAVDEGTLPETLAVTHRSLFDGSLQGIKRLDAPAFAFQGHPEASPGPQEIDELFDHFIDLMQAYKAI